MLILGIESSCDETAVALVRNGREVLLSQVSSQIDLHVPYGGIVPEVACRAHAEWLLPMLAQVEAESGLPLGTIDAVAATARPGLIGALLVGLTAGKTLAYALDRPFVGVDHIDGHIHAPRMAFPDIPFPHVALVVSGGHTDIYLCPDATSKVHLAGTADDAAGECFDKVSALLGLGYPGGPRIEALAASGRADAVDFPRGQPGTDGLAISFSGLKTAVLHVMQRHGFDVSAGRPRLAGKQQSPSRAKAPDGPRPTPADIAASFQEAVVDTLIRASLAAVEASGTGTLTLTGGVACNTRLREKLAAACQRRGVAFFAAPRNLCTDNAAFIAGAAYAFAAAGRYDELSLAAIPN